MFTAEELNEIGWALEDDGFTHSEINEWFEHAGVKGMKWGQRKSGPAKDGFIQRSRQKQIDSIKKTAAGTASNREKFRAVNSRHDITLPNLVKGKGIQGGAKLSLERQRKVQARMRAGEMKATQILFRMNGIRYKDLNFD